MSRSVISLVAGLVLAVIAVVLLNYYIRNVRAGDGAQAAAPADVTQVLVAAVDLPFGAKLKLEDFKSVSWPTASMPEDAFHTPDEVFAGADGQDRIVLKPIAKDEPVLKSHISGFGAKATLSNEVPRGMRAVSIRIDDVSGVAGFLLPGDRVDVMLTRKLEGKDPNDSLATDIILQSVQVLGIDQLADQDRDKPIVARTATLAVTPQDAQKLALAQQAGTLGLALRNVNSVDTVPTGRIVQGDLTPPELKPPPQAYHRRHWAPAGVVVVYGAK
jgi:pilus assembly protein CpaB